MAEFKDYKELNKTFDYDKKKAEVYAEAATELIEVRKREKYLTNLLIENKDLSPFIWTTATGEAKALHSLESDHLRNILKHIVDVGGVISAQIKAEALSRGFEIPEESTTRAGFNFLNNGRMIDAEVLESTEEWDN